MAIALELQRRGHRCVIATSSIYREKVEAAGLEFFNVRPDLPEPDSAEAAEMIRRVSDTWSGPEYLFRELLTPKIRETYEDTLAAVEADGGADLLVSHQVALTAPIVAAKTGVKWISCVLFPISFASVYDPPTPPQFPPIRSLVALHPLIAKPLMEIGKWSMESWVEPIQELRRELGLARSAHPIFEGQHSPTRVLALFSKHFARMQPDFPANTVITGFPFYDEPNAEVQPELMQFLDGGEPPILFTLGSSLVWSAGDFYRVSIEAAKRLGKRALLLIGDKRNLPQEKLPEGIAAFDYAPHNLVMPRCSAIVHQGGIGTTAQALRSGRPMLIVPHGQDQPDNARRCVELDVALTLTPASYTAARVTAELSQMIDNSEIQMRASGVGEQVRAEHGTMTACREIERVLAECVNNSV